MSLLRFPGKPMMTEVQNIPFQALRAYWEALRLDGDLPRRDRIDARGLADHLAHILLVERIAPGHGRLRLAGSAVQDVLGMEARGMPLTAILEPASRARLQGVLDSLFDAPAILDIGLEAERGIGRPALSGRLLLLPLVGGPGRGTGQAIGCLKTTGHIGRVPRRFAISGLTSERILLAAPMPLPVRAARTLPGFAESPEAVPLAARGHLRLVHSR